MEATCRVVTLKIFLQTTSYNEKLHPNGSSHGNLKGIKL